jgi:FkbM family methyltransferase
LHLVTKPKLIAPFETKLYEAAAAEVLENYKGSQPEVIVDVGAHIGAVSLMFGSNGSEFIAAVEPDVDNFRCLLEGIQVNNCMGRILPIPVAITNNSFDKVYLYKGSNNSGERGLKYDPKRFAIANITLTMSLNDLLIPIIKRFGAIDFLKIDIEGGEWEILTPSNTLTDLLSKVKYIDVECHPLNDPDYFSTKTIPGSISEMATYLNETGFAVSEDKGHRTVSHLAGFNKKIV